MKLSYEDHGPISVIKVSGDLTVDQADALRRSLQERFDAGIRDVVLEVGNMTFVDSSGLEALLWIIDEAAARGGQLRLVSPDETVRKILEITRLDRRFHMHESIESAAKSLR
jgi:anti-sigma B factor antagonist